MQTQIQIIFTAYVFVANEKYESCLQYNSRLGYLQSKITGGGGDRCGQALT